MKPTEKATELIEKFQSLSGFRRFAIGYAIICVEEIIAEINQFDTMDGYAIGRMYFYEEVLTELKAMQ